MEAENKSNGNLFGSLIQHIKDPFLVLDVSGNILSFNDEASELLSINNDTSSFYSALDATSTDDVKFLLENKLPIKTPITQDAKILISSGDELEVKLILNSYEERDETFIFCRIRKDEKKLIFGGKTELIVNADGLQEIIDNTEILKIIEEIRSQYPFTFIGKEKLQKSIDSLSELFWVQDIDGNYQLLNNKLSDSIGVDISQVDGYPVSSFLPAHLQDFYTSIIEYIKKSLRYCVIEGLPIKSSNNDIKYQTIEVPLSDVDNNVIAIIGITQKAVKKNNIKVSNLFESSLNLIENFPKPFALIDKEGIIKQSTEEFRKLFETELQDFSILSYRRLLPSDVVKLIEEFFDSSADKKKYKISKQLKFKKKYSGDLVIQLNKIYDENANLEGVAILVEKNDDITDLEKLIVRRGKMFEILIENNPEPIFIYDTENLRFLETNKAALDLYGYRKDELLQMDLTDLYTPEDIQSLLDTSAKGTNLGEFSGPYRHKKKDGSSVFVEISRISFKFKEKDAHFNIVRDVSKNLELEKKYQAFHSIFNNTSDLVFVTDSGGFINFVNKAAVSELGYSENDYDKSSFATYVKDSFRAEVNNSIFKSEVKDEIELKVEIKKSDGEFFEAKLSATPVLDYNGNIDSFTILVSKKEKPVIEAEPQIKEVIKEVFIDRPAAKNVSSGGEDSGFLSSLFHEILTPINVILGFVQDLTDGITNLTPEQKESADIISQNRERLLNTMNSIIEYSNIERGNSQVNPSNMAITEIIDYLQQNIVEITGSKKTEFGYGKISSSLKFETDKPKFQHLITLLIRITAHLSKEKKIYFSAYPEDDDNFVISIKDNYSFISPYMLNVLKNIFSEIEESQDFGISKLSLRLSKSLLTILNGRFEVTKLEQEKVDCKFVFPVKYTQHKTPVEKTAIVEQTDSAKLIDDELLSIGGNNKQEVIPDVEEYSVQSSHTTEEIEGTDEPEVYEEEIETEFQEESIYDAKPSGAGNFAISQLSCLYIEDQVDSQILFKVQMKELKEIKFAVSFEEALPLLDSHNFDFIVMDINLQGEYNGLDALKIVKRMPGHENIPVIAVTAYVLPGDKEKFIATGFNDFISKPIFREKMIDSLGKIFTLQH